MNRRKKALYALLAAMLIWAMVNIIFAQPIKEHFFITGNIETMKVLVKPEQLNAVKASIQDYFGDTNRTYSLQDLFEWQNNHLRWADSFPWFGLGRPRADPIDILNAGIGHCGEYAILFTAACLAVGYDARIALVVKSDYSFAPHEFCMVRINDSWVQVDSSCYAPNRLVFNDTSPYQTWDWGPLVGKTYSIFTFDANNAYNVTGLFV